MSVKRNVFGSNTERQNFYKLSRQWEDKYRIYHNLPFLNVFDWKRVQKTKTLDKLLFIF